MKKLFNAFLALAAGLAIAGCAKEYDDSALQDKVNNLDKKVTELEKKVNALTEQVTGLATTIDEWKKGGFVESVTDIKEGDTVIGYTVTFVGGKTVVLYNGKDGAPGKDGNPGAPGKDGEKGATGADGQTPTIILYEGNLVWAIGDKPILVDNKPVPANVVPTFAINDEGHLIMTLLGQETDLGKVKGEDGAAGTGGDSILKSIEKSADGKNLVFTLNGDPEVVYEIPFATAFKLVIENTQIEAAAGKTVEIPFKVENGTAEMVDFFVNNSAYEAKIVESKLVVTVPDPFQAAQILVWAKNDNGLISLVKLSFITAADVAVVTPAEDIAAIPAAAGDFVIDLTSNVDLDAKVPEAATWVKAVVTKADYKLTLTLEENTTGEPREAEIEIVRADNGATVKTIKIVQLYEAPAPLDPAQAGDVLWAEDWSAVPTDKEKSEVEDYDYSSTVVYGGRKVAYAITHSASTTSKSQLYYDTQYGYKDNGTAVKDGNLLIAKGNGTFTVSGIPVAEAKAATLTFKVNAKRDVTVTSPTENVTVGERTWGEETSKPYSATVKITFGENVEKFALLFTNADAGNNVRVDDLKVVVDGEPAVKEPALERVWGLYNTGAEAYWFADVKDGSAGMAATTDRNIAMDDDYIYLAKSSAYPQVFAIDRTDPSKVKKLPINGIAGGTHPISCVRVVKNTDPAVNNGKDILLVSNLKGDYELKVFAYLNGIEADPTQVLIWQWDNHANASDWRRYGDKFTVTGTWQNGAIWFQGWSDGKALYFPLNGGIDKPNEVSYVIDATASAIKDIAVYPGQDTEVFITSYNKAAFWTKSADKNANNWILWTEGAAMESLKNTYGYNFFAFNGKNYIAYTKIEDTTHSRIQVMEDNGAFKSSLDAKAGLMELPLQHASDFATASPAAGQNNGDCTVRIIDDEVYIAALGSDMGLSLFKMVLK